MNKKPYYNIDPNLNLIPNAKNYEENLDISRDDLIWLSAFVEGEGTFGIDKRTKYKKLGAPPTVNMRVTSTDKDVILNASRIVKKPNFKANEKTKGGKTEYILDIASRGKLIYLLPRMYPVLFSRRKARVLELIQLLNDWIKWFEAGGRSISAREGGLETARRAKEKKDNKDNS